MEGIESRGIAVIIVHGITTQSVGYSRIFQQNVIRRLPARLRPEVQFFEVFWANRIRTQQSHYVQRAEEMANLKFGLFRTIALRGLGDAAAYQKGGASLRDTAYVQIQEELHHAVRTLDDPDRPLRPLVFVGHSLGCHIISSFIWDSDRLGRLPPERAAEPGLKGFRYVWEELASENATPFRRLETLAGIVTLGNNMPLFAFSLAPDKIVPITKAGLLPGRALSPERVHASRWINVYDGGDPLGYPLRALSLDYEDDRIVDLRLSNLGAVSPVGKHTRYWSSHRVAAQTAGLIKAIVTAN